MVQGSPLRPSASLPTPRVLIAGGGVGGLAAGLALCRAGFDVRVFEQAAAPRATGAGLWLWPNALAALDHLGVAGTVRAAGVIQTMSVIRDWQGRALMRIAPRDSCGAPAESVSIHRPALLAVLRDALGSDYICYGRRAAGFEQDERGVQLKFEDGRAEAGDVLVGADGLLSAIRAQLVGDEPPRDGGFTAWRAVIPFEGASGAVWGRRGGRFGFMTVGDGRINWFGGTADHAPDLTAEQRKAFVAGRFAHWPDPVTAVIAATPPGSIMVHRVFDRPPLGRWSHGRVTLLGDAAHPMTPSLGQGACQALEDAVVLGRVLGAALRESDPPDLTAALTNYDRLRRPRANAIAARSRRVDAVIQWSWPPACALRDRVAASLPDALRQRWMASLWQFDPPGA